MLHAEIYQREEQNTDKHFILASKGVTLEIFTTLMDYCFNNKGWECDGLSESRWLNVSKEMMYFADLYSTGHKGYCVGFRIHQYLIFECNIIENVSETWLLCNSLSSNTEEIKYKMTFSRSFWLSGQRHFPIVFASSRLVLWLSRFWLSVSPGALVLSADEKPENLHQVLQRHFFFRNVRILGVSVFYRVENLQLEKVCIIKNFEEANLVILSGSSGPSKLTHRSIIDLERLVNPSTINFKAQTGILCGLNRARFVIRHGSLNFACFFTTLGVGTNLWFFGVLKKNYFQKKILNFWFFIMCHINYFRFCSILVDIPS